MVKYTLGSLYISKICKNNFFKVRALKNSIFQNSIPFKKRKKKENILIEKMRFFKKLQNEEQNEEPTLPFEIFEV